LKSILVCYGSRPQSVELPTSASPLLFDQNFSLRIFIAVFDRLMKSTSAYDLNDGYSLDQLSKAITDVDSIELIYQGSLAPQPIVRAAALLAIGKFPRAWLEHHLIDRAWSCDNGSSQFSPLAFIVDHSHHDKATVRSAAFQCLGELFANHGFDHLFAAVSSSDASTAELSIHSHNSFQMLIDRLSVGCKDNKVVVRLQAIWTLGNFLLCILPHRQHYVFDSSWSNGTMLRSLSPKHSTNETEINNANILSDNFWMQTCEVSFACLEVCSAIL
jgi:hypothetical protein